jgi:Tfp pilus assembly protein PilN
MVDRDSASRMLRELPDILPKELWLSSFSVEGSKASFKGRALNIDTVNEFLAKVNLSTHYRDGQSSMSEKKDELTGRLIQDFEIKASRRASNEF